MKTTAFGSAIFVTALILVFAAAGASSESGAGAAPATGASRASLFTGETPAGHRPEARATIPFEQIGTVAGKQYSGDGLAVVASPDGARLRCVFQRLEAQVTTAGLSLASTVDGPKAEPFRVIARTVGRQESVALPPQGRVEVAGKSARWIRPGLTEEYMVGVDGIRQDFVISQQPEGTGPVRVELEVSGAKAEPMARGARLVLAESGRKLAYHRLKAEDQRGQELPVRLEVVSADRLALVLDDATAQYPVRIDPTFSDDQWVSLGGAAGTDGVVESTDVDADGNLYIGGSFTTAGQVAANFIAQWNGSEWLPLGSGMNDVVDSVYVAPDGSVYAGGSFTVAGGVPANAIAKWNGSFWSALGGGLTDGYPWTFVHAIVVSGDTVYAGGNFEKAGGIPAFFIAQWDGNSWAPMGTGMGDFVYDLKLWRGDVYACGSFVWGGGTPMANYVARWDGGAWSALGRGVDYGVSGLAVWEDNLYLAGNFSKAINGNGEEIPARYVARWDGNAWSALGSGLNNTAVAIVASDDGLFVGGIFTTAGGVPASAIARWNGATWSALDSGIHVALDGARDVKALAAFGDTLYVGGHFQSAGDASVNYIARWDGASWSGFEINVGPDHNVNALAVSDDSLYAGGLFTFAGGVRANYIARWNGSSWSSLGLGLNGFVDALAASGSNVYVGGNFTSATNPNGQAVPVNYIAQWNGSAWTALGNGVNNRVYSLATSGTDLYAGGDFTTASNSGGGAVTVNRIAQWNGNSWSALGSGMSGEVGLFFEGPSVRALAVSGDTVYAAGRFRTAGSVTANNIAKWNGISWEALGLGIAVASSGFLFPFGPPPISALAVSDAYVYVGGSFGWVTNSDGIAVPASLVAAWDGSEWTALGTGLFHGDPLRSVRALALASDGTLYAGGLFNSSGGVPISLVAQWDGSGWYALGSGISGNGFNGANVFALATSGTSLFVGGAFTRAGTVSSAYAAQAILGPPSIPARSCRMTPNNESYHYGFDVSGGALQRVIIEASTDLTNWGPVQTNVTGSGPLHFVDPNADKYPMRFYRVQQVK